MDAWGCKTVNGFGRVPWIRKYIPRIFVLWCTRVPPLEFWFVDFLLLNYTLSTVCEEGVFPEEISRSQNYDFMNNLGPLSTTLCVCAGLQNDRRSWFPMHNQGTFRVTLSMRKEPQGGPVFCKMETTQRFKQLKTVKLHTDTTYRVDVSFKPPRALQ